MRRHRKLLVLPERRLIRSNVRRRLPDARFPHIWIPKIIPARAAVTLDVKGTEQAFSGTTTPFNYTGLSPSTGLSNPAVIFSVTCTPSTTFSAVSATWAGTTCSFIGSINQLSGLYSLSLFGLVNPALGTGHTFAFTPTGTIGAANDVYIVGASFSGVNQTGGSTSFPNFNSKTSNGSAVLSQTLAITTASGNYTFCASSNGNSGSSTASTPGTNNQVFIDNTDPGGAGSGSMAAINSSTSTSTTYTFSMSPNDFLAMSGCDILAAAGGVTLHPVIDSYNVPMFGNLNISF